MRIGVAGEFLERAIVKRKVVLLKGKPGVGKTFSWIQAAHNTGRDFIGVSGPLLSPVKIGGYPRAPKDDGGDATHCLFDGIARAFRATKPTVFHVDDLALANGETLKCVLDLFQFGRIDDRKLPDCVTVGASTNDIGHGADVQGMIEPLKNRFDTIVEVETHIDDVVVYGLSKGWPGDLLAYLRNNTKALHDWQPSKSIANDGATPRGWEHVAEWINDGFDDKEVIAGCVGKGQATAYLAFRGIQAQLPDIAQILMDPKGAPVPEDPSAKLMIACTLAGKLDAGNFGQVIQYTNRMDGMFQAFAVRDAFRAEVARKKAGTLPDNWRALSSSRDFTAWSVSDRGQAIMSANKD